MHTDEKDEDAENTDKKEEYPSVWSYVNISSVDLRIQLDVLRKFVFYSVVNSERMRLFEHAGRHVISCIFTALAQAAMNDNYDMLPADWQKQMTGALDRNTQEKEEADASLDIYDDDIEASIRNRTDLVVKDKARVKMRIICDFISSMSDSYALDFFKRLQVPSDSPIFKAPETETDWSRLCEGRGSKQALSLLQSLLRFV